MSAEYKLILELIGLKNSYQFFIAVGSVNNFVYGSFWLLSGVVYCVTLTW